MRTTKTTTVFIIISYEYCAHLGIIMCLHGAFKIFHLEQTCIDSELVIQALLHTFHPTSLDLLENYLQTQR